MLNQTKPSRHIISLCGLVGWLYFKHVLDVITTSVSVKRGSPWPNPIIAVTLRGWVRKFCHRCCNFVNRHDRLLCYTLIERATFLLYNDANRKPERNKYLETDALKDTWGKTNGTFSRICEYHCVRFMRHIFKTADQIFSNFTVINNSIFRKAM